MSMKGMVLINWMVIMMMMMIVFLRRHSDMFLTDMLNIDMALLSVGSVLDYLVLSLAPEIFIN